MKNNVGRGAFVLVVSGLICKLFGGLFRLPLTNIISIEGIGIFQMVMSLFSLALVFVSGGVTNSLSKLVSSARAAGEGKKIGSYLKYALIFSLGLSLAISIFFFIFAKPLASVQGIEEGRGAYILVAFILPIGALIGVSRGLLQGYNNMTPTAISQIIEQVTKFALGLLFAYLFVKGGAERGVFGAFLGILFSEALALVYLGFRTLKTDKFTFSAAGRREFFDASLPLTFGGVIIPLVHAIEALFIVTLLCKTGMDWSTARTLYGLQTGVVGALLNFPLIISVSLAVSLLPNLSYLATRGDRDAQRKMIEKSFTAMWYILLPLVFGIMSIAGEIYPIIYPKMGNYLEIAENLTIITGISTILTAIMQFLLSILQANGFYSYSLVYTFFGGIAKLAYLFLFAPTRSISIFAIAISNILLSFIVIVCILFKLGDLIKFPVFDLVLPLLSAGIMFMGVRLLLSLVGGYYGVILSVLAGGGAYFLLTFPLTRNYAKMIVAKLK